MKNEINNPSSITNPKKLIIIIRHGERKDRAGETPKYHRMNSELTEKGKLQSFNVSKTFLEEIKKYGITDISLDNIQIRTSPYLRTIQTAVYFIKGLNEIFSNNKNNNKVLNKLYIDFSLRKTIKKKQKREDEDSSLYSSIDAYHIFDEEIKNIELIKENANFPTEVESREQSEKRTIDYVNTVLKKEVEDNNNNNNNEYNDINMDDFVENKFIHTKNINDSFEDFYPEDENFHDDENHKIQRNSEVKNLSESE